VAAINVTGLVTLPVNARKGGTVVGDPGDLCGEDGGVMEIVGAAALEVRVTNRIPL